MVKRIIYAVGLVALIIFLSSCGKASSGGGMTPAANLPLSGLSLSSGTLSPTFSRSVASYTTTVTNSVSSVTLTPVAADTSSTITVGSMSATSGTASSAVPLSIGLNTILVKVAESSGTVTTYTIKITRLNVSKTYYVSTTGNNTTGDGSSSKPWATPAYGVSKLNAGDTLIILGGKYVLKDYNNDVIRFQSSGTAAAPIVVRGEIGNRPVLAGHNNEAPSASNNYAPSGLGLAIDLGGQSYLRLENLEITHDPSVTGWQVYFRDGITGDGNHIVFKDLYIHHLDQFGVNITNIDNFTVKDCIIQYCGFGALGGADGNNGWTNVVIDGCNLSYNGHYYQGQALNGTFDEFRKVNPYPRPDGIGLEESDGPVEVKNCVVEHNWGDGIDLKNSVVYVHHNLVANNSSDGVKLWGYDCRLENCVIYGTGDGAGGASSWAGIVLESEVDESNFYVENNTIHDNAARENHPMYVQYDVTEEAINMNLYFSNNIVAGGYGTVFIRDNTNFVAKNNIFYRNGSESNYTVQVQANGKAFTKTNIGDLGVGNIVADPKFVQTAWGVRGDYSVQSDSPAIDTGTSNVSVIDDYEKTLRPKGGYYDIGAYEY